MQAPVVESLFGISSWAEGTEKRQWWSLTEKRLYNIKFLSLKTKDPMDEEMKSKSEQCNKGSKGNIDLKRFK